MVSQFSIYPERSFLAGNRPTPGERHLYPVLRGAFMVYDFHTHTFASDGMLGGAELIRRAEAAGYAAIGISDHASSGNLEAVIATAIRDCQAVQKFWQIRAIPGIELTHVPPELIAPLAKRAKALGAKIVVVHGETIVEPVPAGTNLAAVQCPDVDILAHPGLLTAEAAKWAAQNGIYLELSARKGHGLTNGLVAGRARECGAKLLVNSDAHAPEDLLNPTFQEKVAQGAGLSEAEIEQVFKNAEALIGSF
jgi:putative hydrolase